MTSDSITSRRIARIYAMVLAAAGIAVAFGVLLFYSFRSPPTVKPLSPSAEFPSSLVDSKSFDIRKLGVGESVCYLYWYVSKERHVWLHPTPTAIFENAEECKFRTRRGWGTVTRVSESYWKISVKNRKLELPAAPSDAMEKDAGEIRVNEVVIE